MGGICGRQKKPIVDGTSGISKHLDGGPPKQNMDKIMACYKAMVHHRRVKPQLIIWDGGVMDKEQSKDPWNLIFARVVLPTYTKDAISGSGSIFTPKWSVTPAISLLFSVEEVYDRCKAELRCENISLDEFLKRFDRLEYLTAPQSRGDLNHRFGVLELYFLYETGKHETPFCHIVESSDAWGVPQVLYFPHIFADDGSVLPLGEQLMRAPDGFSFTPFTYKENHYQSQLSMAGPLPSSILVYGFTKETYETINWSDPPDPLPYYISIELHWEEITDVPFEEVDFKRPPIDCLLEATCRLGAISTQIPAGANQYNREPTQSKDFKFLAPIGLSFYYESFPDSAGYEVAQHIDHAVEDTRHFFEEEEKHLEGMCPMRRRNDAPVPPAKWEHLASRIKEMLEDNVDDAEVEVRKSLEKYLTHHKSENVVVEDTKL